MNAFFIIGIPLVSIATAIAILSEYARVCRSRNLLFRHLGGADTGTRAQRALMSLYVSTTAVILVGFLSAFLRIS